MQLPAFKEEKSETDVCPFPREIQVERRSLQRAKRGSINRVYKFSATGICKRCRRKRRRHLEFTLTGDVCSIAKETMLLRNEVQYAAATANGILDIIKIHAASEGAKDVAVLSILTQANAFSRECQKTSQFAEIGADKAMKLCSLASRMGSPTTASLQKQVTIQFKVVSELVSRAKAGLADIRKLQRDVDTYIYIRNRRRLRASRPFGIKDIVLVDAITNRDMLGALDCGGNAANNCFGSSTLFNIRAQTFGFVRRVHLTCEGPAGLEVVGYDQSFPPYSVWGDRSGKYEQKTLLPGEYTITAQAADYWGRKSELFSKTFTVDFESQANDPPTKAPTFLPTISPTSQQSSFPTETEMHPSNDTRTPSFSSYMPVLEEEDARETEYLHRLSANLDMSNTACEEVKQAMVQKTIAEETLIQSDATYDDVMMLATNLEGNPDVERIKDEAKSAHLRVQVEATKARAAADLASNLCDKVNASSLRRLANINEELEREALDALTAVVDARQWFTRAKHLKDEMEEVISLNQFDPSISDLKNTNPNDEATLLELKQAVEAEILQVQSQIQALPESSDKIAALENKKEFLLKEKADIEEALSGNHEFTISQSALKKDQFYVSVAPDFDESPPLQYILTTTQTNANLMAKKNWDDQSETSGSKEEWFRRFGDLLAILPRRLRLVYKTETGGCLKEDSALSVTVIITEIESIWETLNPEECTLDTVGGSSNGQDGNPVPGNREPPSPPPVTEPTAKTTDFCPAASSCKASCANTLQVDEICFESSECCDKFGGSHDDACKCSKAGSIRDGACTNEEGCINNQGTIGQDTCDDQFSCVCNSSGGQIGAVDKRDYSFSFARHCSSKRACRFNQGQIGKCSSIARLKGKCNSESCEDDDACGCNTGTIVSGSCNGKFACENNAHFIDYDSCNSDGHACLNNNSSIGGGSCNAPGACKNNHGKIGQDKCNKKDACQNCGLPGGTCS